VLVPEVEPASELKWELAQGSFLELVMVLAVVRNPELE
jgi:hypothetical protein